MPEGKKSGGLYMDDDVWNGIAQLAERDKRSFNSYVNIVLRNHWEKNRSKLKPVKLVKRSA